MAGKAILLLRLVVDADGADAAKKQLTALKKELGQHGRVVDAQVELVDPGESK